MGFLFPKQPEAKPTRMPTSNDAVVRAAAARERRAVGERTGRSSTILTQPGSTAGTQPYANSLLGQAR